MHSSAIYTPTHTHPEELQKEVERGRNHRGKKKQTLPQHQCPELRAVRDAGKTQVDEQLEFPVILERTLGAICSGSREVKCAGHI